MYLNGLVLTRKETLVAVETGWAADVKSVSFHCCFKIDMRLVLESKGSTSHHCCSLQVAAFVVHLPSKVAREDMTPIPICSEASTSDKGGGTLAVTSKLRSYQTHRLIAIWVLDRMQPTAWKQYSEIEKTSCNLFYLLFNKYMFIYNIVGVVPVFYC